MKKYTLFLIITILIFGIIFAPKVQAGKPKPTAYPNPIFEALAYPDPNFPFPGEPPPDKGYVWGAYYIDAWRWYISKYTPTADPDAIVNLCTAQENPYHQTCYYHRNGYSESLQYIGYDNGMSWYQSIPISPCGWWGAMPDTSYWNSEDIEIHQPNWYRVPCAVWDNPFHFPVIRR